MSTVLSDAKRNEIIEKNPARMIELPETASRIQLIPTDEEAHRFLDILANADDPYKIFCALAIYTDCRSSVLGQGVVEGSTKNGQARTIYLSEDMTSILRSYCYQKMREAQEGGFKMSDYVFTNETGKLMHPDTFSRHLRRLYDKNSFPREFHLHTLRHYFVSTMLHSGVD